MIHKIDLHIHTSASDGQYCPSDIVRMAAQKGLHTIAITDHDTVDGITEALIASERYGVWVIPGVELSANGFSRLHILGYQINIEDKSLVNLCNEMKISRDERKYRIIDFLRTKGLNIDLAEVEAVAQGNIIARPHFAQVLVQKNYVSDIRQAFDCYLDTEDFKRIERPKPTASRCIEAIHSAGGKAVLAHPKLLKLSNEKLDLLLKGFVDRGLDGIECFYSTHTAEETNYYCQLTEKYGLIKTLGSDFHGELIKSDIELGTVNTYGMNMKIPFKNGDLR